MKQLISDNNFSFHDEKLLELIEKNNSIDLGSGKIGFAIYFFVLSRLKKNNDYRYIAEKYLDDVFNQIQLNESLDISHGLSGIGLGILFMIENNFVQGDINKILQDVDDRLFTELSYPESYQSFATPILIDLLIYFSTRLKHQRTGCEQDFLYKELIIHTVNILYEKIEFSFFEEPTTYTVKYQLPLLLYVLAEIYKSNFYNRRIIQITNELSLKIFSIVPTLNANKLFLLWGVNRLFKEIKEKKWKEHIYFLAGSIKIDTILNDELRDRNIFFENGLTSIYLLADELKCFHSEEEICVFKQKVLYKICHSQVWKMLENEEYFLKNIGLLNGYCGVSLLMHKIK